MHDYKLPNLNLPEIDIRIKDFSGKLLIWDRIRKKFIALTPEEWVRQHFIHLLIDHLDYPASLFKIESSLKYNRLKKRTDIEVLDRKGKIFLLIECKAPDVTLTKKTLMQASMYNHTLRSPYIAITNGMKHLIWKFHPESNTYTSLKEFPSFPY